MSSAGISFGGLASGLDTKAIISALVAVERRPITALETKKTSLGKQKSLFSDLKGLLDKLTTAAKKLKTSGDFLKMKATSDDESIVTASASSSATPGSYTVKVKSLATAQVNAVGNSSRSTPLDGGTVSFMVTSGGVTHVVSTNDSSLDGIAAAINTEDDASDIGVRAEVIDTGNSDPSQRYQLVVRAKDPGAQNGFTIDFDDGGATFQQLIEDLGGNPVSPAGDAELVVNNISVFRSTNTVSDLWNGISLDLKSADDTKDVTITVATDAEETSKNVKEMVDAYNAVVDFFQAQNALDADGKAKSPVFGDATLRSMRSSLRQIAGGLVSDTGNDAYQLLSQIGIKADTQGKLEFNQSKFEEALSTDENAVTALFTNAGTGIAARFETQIDVYTDSVDGLLKSRSDSFDRQVKDTQRRIDDGERRLTLYEQQLTVKYANLETLLAKLQGQGSSIGNIAQSTR
ncbi:MAG: flagellar filament capping protein FliD [Planctomycetes bacterium]|nr:flagellar filament capping protein FliD [Planctomycetota bacterium]